jgi:cytochrome c oxidase cbb3-type subunit 3
MDVRPVTAAPVKLPAMALPEAHVGVVSQLAATSTTVVTRVACLAGYVLLAACTRHDTAPAAATSTLPAIQYEAHISAGERPPSAGELNNPLHADPAAAKNGAALFTAMNCDGCHGGDGSGWVGPSLADGRWRYGGADAEIFNSIYFGRPKGMPAFGGTLGTTAVWSIVSYLKSLTPPPNEPTESWEE